jgi:hypothetical protein
MLEKKYQTILDFLDNDEINLLIYQKTLKYYSLLLQNYTKNAIGLTYYLTTIQINT